MKKTVVVIGASSKLGLLVCASLERLGNTVYAGYNTTPIPGSKSIVPIKLDTSHDAAFTKAVKKIISTSKKIDAVIYLAGISPSGEWGKFTPMDFSTVLEINTIGVFRAARAFMPHLLRSNGHFVSVSSLAGLISFPNYSIYSASKFALRALSTSLYHELYPKIKVTCVFPGAIDFGVQIESPKSARTRVPLLKYLLPLVSAHQVVKIITNLLSDTNPPAEVKVGTDTIILDLLHRLLPNTAWYYLQRFIWERQK